MKFEEPVTPPLPSLNNTAPVGPENEIVPVGPVFPVGPVEPVLPIGANVVVVCAIVELLKYKVNVLL